MKPTTYNKETREKFKAFGINHNHVIFALFINMYCKFGLGTTSCDFFIKKTDSAMDLLV